MNLNVRGYFLLAQEVAKRSMIARRGGRIINIASIAGLGGNPPELQMIAYNTSKGAVDQLHARAGLRSGASTTSPSTRSVRASFRAS